MASIVTFNHGHESCITMLDKCTFDRLVIG